jgi:hypothetical protein
MLFSGLDGACDIAVVFYFFNQHLIWIEAQRDMFPSTNYCTCFCCRSGHPFHASTLGERAHPPGHVALDGYNHANYSQQSLPSFRGQPFQQYHNMTSSYIRPMRIHHNGRPVWTNYSLAEPPPSTMRDGMSWGNFHAFILTISLICVVDGIYFLPLTVLLFTFDLR